MSKTPKIDERDCILNKKKVLINRLTMKRIAKQECESIRKKYGISKEYGSCVKKNYPEVKQKVTKQIDDLAKQDVQKLKPFMLEVNISECFI